MAALLIPIYPHLQGGCPDEEVRATKEIKVKRMNLNVREDLHNAFKAVTAARGENMTNVLIEFIKNYVEKNGVAPKKKGSR